MQMLAYYIAAIESMWGLNPEINFSSTDFTDEEKAYMTIMAMNESDYRGWEVFETAGLLKEGVYEYLYDVNCYIVTLEDYIKIHEYIWYGGFEDPDYAERYFAEQQNEYGEAVDDAHVVDCGDGTYRLFKWTNYLDVTIQDMQILKTSETTYQIVVNVEQFFGDEDEYHSVYEHYYVVIDTISVPESPFAGMTITNVHSKMIMD